MIQELREKLEALKCDCESFKYISIMWGYALDVEESGGLGIVCDENLNALPYMPVEAELIGINLVAGSRVLDVGCLGGYGLFDFTMRRKKAGCPVPRMAGIDVDACSVAVSCGMAGIWGHGLDVSFCEGKSENIPFKSGEFDIVMARGLLPYVRMESTLSEIARVLKPSGAAVIQIHSFGYYWYRFFGVFGKPMAMLYYLRPLISGIWMCCTGRQPRNRLLSETALTSRMLVRLCGKYGLALVWKSDFKRKPLMIFRKTVEEGFARPSGAD